MAFPTTQDVSKVANQLVLTASIAELDALRYTPAGLPALNLWLAHASEVRDAGQLRQVQANVKAVALGALATELALQPVGRVGCFRGFVASPRNRRHVVFHIQAFQQN